MPYIRNNMHITFSWSILNVGVMPEKWGEQYTHTKIIPLFYDTLFDRMMSNRYLYMYKYEWKHTYTAHVEIYLINMTDLSTHPQKLYTSQKELMLRVWSENVMAFPCFTFLVVVLLLSLSPERGDS